MAKDLAYAERTIRKILRQLEKPEGLAHQYAEAVLAQAVRNASGRPTPQAPMAARNMIVRGATIEPSAGGAPSDVAIGSEFGSSKYRQFHASPNPRGYWLYPAATDVATLAAGDQAIEQIMQQVVRGAA